MVDARAHFPLATRYGDVVTIDTRAVYTHRSSLDLEHPVLADDRLAIEGLQPRMWTSRDRDHPGRLLAVPMPSEVTVQLRGD
jgi:acyl-CoA thioesterase FadM